MKKIRVRMFVYLLFILVVVFKVANVNIHMHRAVAYSLLEFFAFAVFILGVIFYAIRFQKNLIQKLWKWMFPLLVVFSFVDFVIDYILYAKVHPNVQENPQFILSYLASAIIGVGIFFPAFRASFILAYGNVKLKDSIAKKATKLE